MKRPWQVWLVFAVCVLGAAGAMLWLTREAVETDRMRRAAQAEAALEQRVSLAVWRMDTELAPIIASEVIRPVAAFQPGTVPAELPPYVLLQFSILPNGTWQSPQLPPGNASEPQPIKRRQELSQAVTYQTLLVDLPDTPLPSAADVARTQFGLNDANKDAESQVNITRKGEQPEDYQFFAGNRGSNYANNTRLPTRGLNPPADSQQQQAQVQAPPEQIAKENDFQQRSKRFQSAAQQSLFNTSQLESPTPNLSTNTLGTNAAVQSKGELPALEQIGVSRPLWVGDRLLLARRVTVVGHTIVQGSWLDWSALKERLLGEATDLIPKADLVPVKDDGADDPSRMLAGLPVRLVTNETASDVAVGPTLRWALWIGWGAVVLAVVAAAVLLQGVMALSERRAAFVSSVTHELRTPLTTFRMYAEMLAKGMVPDAARRQEYYETLQKESERLNLLVENVLSYARLERGRKPQAQDRVTLSSLLARIGPRLKQRAAQAEMECVFNPPLVLGESASPNRGAPSPCPLPEGEGSHVEFTTDSAVVEQILFNLVDNAAKYARTATDRRIHVEANRNGQYVRLGVRDHGPGIGGDAAERTQAFEKSAQESAETAPGVGLGLALCRRLAKQLGGRLDVVSAPGAGAAVTLWLPAG